jgi:outer membrane protein OmpA-like peptidoglycan-associated protein
MKIFTTLFLVVFSVNLFSQQYAEEPYAPRMSYGLFGGLSANLHAGSFKGIPNIPNCCPNFTTGFGVGPYFGFNTSFPIDNKLELNVRVLYQTLSGDFTSTEDEVFASANGGGVTGQFEHRMNFGLSTAGLNLLLNYRLTDKFRVNGGLRVGTLINKTYDQLEVITNPSNGVFVDSQTRERNKSNGTMPNASALDLGLTGGISYDIPLNDSYSLFLVPEANAALSLIPYISGLSWNTISLYGGVGIKYAPRKVIIPKPKKQPSPPPPPPPLPPPPPPPAAPTLDATILAVAVEEDGTESNISNIRVEEFMTNRTHPLLNYVFFDDNSYVLPQRYIRLNDKQKKAFNYKEFSQQSTIQVYYNFLNIVGKRMAQYPQAEITLTGCISDVGLEKDNIALSQQRAETIKDYLIKEWGIQESRIKIQTRELPEIASNNADPAGVEENRRVEITSNVSKIIEPIVVNDTTRTSNPPTIRFKPEIKAKIGIKEWKILTSQLDKDLKVFSGENQVPSQIDWDVKQEKEQTFMPKINLPLQYRLKVNDYDNKTLESPKQLLPVNTVTIQKKIEELLEDNEIFKLSMIGFPYNKADIVGVNEIIAKSAKSRVKKNSIVKVTGHSDRLGTADLNKKLSQKRAEEVAKFLGLDPKIAKGIGEDVDLYGNESPEGRFYNRTVKIEIVTPLQ